MLQRGDFCLQIEFLHRTLLYFFLLFGYLLLEGDYLLLSEFLLSLGRVHSL